MVKRSIATRVDANLKMAANHDVSAIHISQESFVRPMSALATASMVVIATQA
jgi:hypothetical protein